MIDPFSMVKQTKTKLSHLLIVVISLVVILVVSLIGIVLGLNNRVLPKTWIGGQNVALYNFDKAVQSINQKIDQLQNSQILIVTENADQKYYSLEDLGIGLDAQATQNKLKNDRTFTWTLRAPFEKIFAAIATYDLPLVVNIDESKLTNSLNTFLGPLGKAAVDARLEIQDGKVRVVSDQAGLGYNTTQIGQRLVQQISSWDASGLKVTSQPLNASLTAADLSSLAISTQKIIDQPLVININNQEYKIEPQEIGEWLNYDQNQTQVTIDPEKIEQSLNKIAQVVNKPAEPTKIIANTDAVLTEGSVGSVLDTKQAKTEITQTILSNPSQKEFIFSLVEEKPKNVEVANSAAPSTRQGKVIRVVLSEQRLYAWDNGQLARTTYISSGLPGTPTPAGDFAVRNKILDHVMAGEGYYLPHVPHSMYFYGTFALHGAYWHNNFGYPMSHGCVNLPLDEAAWLYNWAEIGTPVEIRY